jgi:predicted oxidoreductase
MTESPDDIAEEIANHLEIYGEDRCEYVSQLIRRMRDAVRNELLLKQKLDLRQIFEDY